MLQKKMAKVARRSGLLFFIAFCPCADMSMSLRGFCHPPWKPEPRPPSQGDVIAGCTFVSIIRKGTDSRLCCPAMTPCSREAGNSARPGQAPRHSVLFLAIRNKKSRPLRSCPG
jgi:hypothetical protein